jgi:ferrous iron transport protein A
MDITQMKEGDKGVVVEICGGCGIVNKLDALGIRPGVEITKISSQFLRGPVILQVGNTQVAIGYGMARRVLVEPK